MKTNTLQSLLTLLLLIAALTTRAQSSIIRYDGRLEWLSDFAVDGAGNVIMVGTIARGNAANAYDCATIKFSSAGVALWTNVYVGLASESVDPSAVTLDTNGNAYVTAHNSLIDPPPGDPIVGDYLTLKYSSAGELLWTRRYNGPDNQPDYAAAVALDGAGNVFVTGTSYGRSTGEDWATVKYSNAGVLLWSRRYQGPVSQDQTFTLAVDGNGNVIVTGFSEGGSGEATIKYSGAGVALWTNRYIGNGRAVAVDRSNNVIVTGWTPSFQDYATIKYSSAGAPLWTNFYNGLSNQSDYATALALDTNGNAIVTGISWNGTTYDFVTVKYAHNGVPQWTNRCDGNSPWFTGVRLALDTSGNAFVSAVSYSGGTRDWVTVKYSGAGVALWTNRYDGPGHGDDYLTGVKVDRSGNVLVTGSSWNGTNSDLVTIKYAPTGPLLAWSRIGPNTLNISWPSSASVSNLQQRTSLASGVWTTPPEPILDNGTTKSISVDTSGGNRFFRLSD